MLAFSIFTFIELYIKDKNPKVIKINFFVGLISWVFSGYLRWWISLKKTNNQFHLICVVFYNITIQLNPKNFMLKCKIFFVNKVTHYFNTL